MVDTRNNDPWRRSLQRRDLGSGEQERISLAADLRQPSIVKGIEPTAIAERRKSID